MISCIIGTRAQLIKMAPVIHSLVQRNLDVEILFTGQHKETMRELMADFQLNIPQRSLYEGSEISGVAKMFFWLIRLVLKAIFVNPLLPDTKLVLVHGDTLSTLLGAIIAKLRGIKIGHVEAGLRSHNMFHPFPEEITRLLVFRLSDISYCPGDWPMENMSSYDTISINTQANTLLDSLRFACTRDLSGTKSDYYGVCSIHRFENIFQRATLEFIIDEIKKASKWGRLAFVLHPATRNQLQKFGLLQSLEHHPNIDLVPRMGYIKFIALIKNAHFVITDGGGNQEELSYLKTPTILMRKATERREGLGETTLLSAYNSELIQRALENAARRTQAVNLPEIYPSEMIADHIQTMLT